MAESLAAHEVPLVGDFSVSAPNPDFADARIGVITFPGTLDDRDAARAVRLAGGTVVELWHDDEDRSSAFRAPIVGDEPFLSHSGSSAPCPRGECIAPAVKAFGT